MQEALAKAKENPSYRFRALYDKLCRQDVLTEAWRRWLPKGGVVGIDGVSFEKIEAYGVSRWLDELRALARKAAAVQTGELLGDSLLNRFLVRVYHSHFVLNALSLTD